ncbi:hypothetical protein ACN28C_22510 [Plantactinospora sp. WMMC1484]|uniref:hypothetical protein n=1 Tax=Plantactinospora sp. WMMC1484 TaxID=3404122 RepID=UPI003BF61AAB
MDGRSAAIMTRRSVGEGALVGGECAEQPVFLVTEDVHRAEPGGTALLGQLDARALYARQGYREVPAYSVDPYAEHWFEKRLGGLDGGAGQEVIRRRS